VGALVGGRDLKAEAVRAGVHLYQVAAAAHINPIRLSRLVNNRAVLDTATEQRIREAIERLTAAPRGR
jgi:hypothetical protein